MYQVTYEFSPVIPDQQFQYAVIPARFQEHWVFVRQKTKKTYELPGGRREKGETILATARRELWEETGARDFKLEQICAFAVSEKGTGPGPETSYGMLYLARIKDKARLPEDSEIGENILGDEMPQPLSYPEIQPGLLKLADSVLHYTIRPARPADGPAIWRLNRLALGYEYELAATVQQLSRVLKEPGSRILLAADKKTGQIAGYIHLADYQTTYSDKLKNILTLAVDPAEQSKSLGRRLLAAGEAWARQQAACGIRLVSSHNRTAAHQFYQACGYSFNKDQKNFKKIF